MEPSEKLIAAIKTQNIQPVSKWRFTLREWLFGAGFLLSVLLGALAFSIVLFAIQQTDFNVLSHLSHSRLEMFLGLLPLIWIGFLLLALVTAGYGIRNSRKGYKFTLARRAGYSAAFSLLLGTAFFMTGGAQWLENAFATNISLYESIQEKKTRLWMAPGQGRLAGQIVQSDNQTLQLRDFNGKTWTILTEGAWVAPIVLLENGEKIKLTGAVVGEDRFQASDIRPWEGPGYRSGRSKRSDR